MPKATSKEKEFERVYKQYYTQMFHKALDWTLDEEIARDLVEDVFADLWQRMESIRIAEVAGLLHTSIRNKAINHIRHRQVEHRYEDDYLAIATEVMEADEDVHEQRLQAIEAIVEEQPAQRRFIFEQCCIEGRTYREVSDIVGVEVSTVHKHVSRVYAELRKVLQILK